MTGRRMGGQARVRGGALLVQGLLLACWASLSASADPDLARSWRVVATNKQEALASTPLAVNGLNSAGMTQEQLIALMWADYKGFFNKTYPTAAQELQARTNFVQSLRTIAQINADDSLSYWASGNKDMDRSFEQFRDRMLMRSIDISDISGLPPLSQRPEDAAAQSPASRAARKAQMRARGLPPDLDWRTRGKVTKVKEQWECGACWAYASVAAMESAMLIDKGGDPSKVDLSVQQLVDCANRKADPQYRSDGCRGGYLTEAIDYVYNRNLTIYSLYQDANRDQACKTSVLAGTRQGQVAKLGGKSRQIWPSRNELVLMDAVNKQPVPHFFYAEPNFYLYKGGIYSSNTCNGRIVNHAMVVVGWSTSGSSDYWIVRNSWSTDWGQDGYVQLPMTGDGSGMCALQEFSVVPPIDFVQVVTGAGSSTAPRSSPPPPRRSPPPPPRRASPPPPKRPPPKRPPPKKPPPSNGAVPCKLMLTFQRTISSTTRTLTSTACQLLGKAANALPVESGLSGFFCGRFGPVTASPTQQELVVGAVGNNYEVNRFVKGFTLTMATNLARAVSKPYGCSPRIVVKAQSSCYAASYKVYTLLPSTTCISLSPRDEAPPPLRSSPGTPRAPRPPFRPPKKPGCVRAQDAGGQEGLRFAKAQRGAGKGKSKGKNKGKGHRKGGHHKAGWHRA